MLLFNKSIHGGGWWSLPLPFIFPSKYLLSGTTNQIFACGGKVMMMVVVVGKDVDKDELIIILVHNRRRRFSVSEDLNTMLRYFISRSKVEQ